MTVPGYSFAEQVVVVTGASSGIGRAIARGFAEGEAKVVFVGQNRERLEEAVEGLPEERVKCCSCDVADREAVNEMMREIEADWGAVDVLVNNAGINTPKRSVAEVAPEDWDRTVAINLTGPFNMVRAALPGMREKGGGLIINVASIAGLRAGKVAGAAYAASKHGLVSLNHSLNEEEKENGIRACVICPGEVETPILDKRPVPVSAEHRACILQPEDVAAAALFVASLPPRVCVAELVITPRLQGFR
jgi:NAD(P)-dependent dehydrogenase (short-subunit alcohol dehydrogenase family)